MTWMESFQHLNCQFALSNVFLEITTSHHYKYRNWGEIFSKYFNKLFTGRHLDSVLFSTGWALNSIEATDIENLYLYHNSSHTFLLFHNIYTEGSWGPRTGVWWGWWWGQWAISSQTASPLSWLFSWLPPLFTTSTPGTRATQGTIRNILLCPILK